MDAQIVYKVDNDITAYIDGVNVRVCYITGYLNGKGNDKITFKTEAERLKNFVKWCESTYKTKFEVVTKTLYTLKWTGGNKWDVYAENDEEAIKIGNSYLNTESGSVTQGERFVGNISPKPPTEWQITRKTWKRRDRTSPR